ncbi:hypothetical protein BGX34_002788, partial [Mortierella sp. NVP85]
MISETVARERVTGSGEGENGAEQTLGDFDLEVSGSTTSLAGSTPFNPMRRVSSPSTLRPFKKLSLKLSVNTLKKLSAFLKSQLNGSKEDPESHRSRDMELNYSSSLVRQEYANYNFERQMEDFQRAAREFKEEKESVEATSGWLLVSEASEVLPESTMNTTTAATHCQTFSSLMFTPIQEALPEEYCRLPFCKYGEDEQKSVKDQVLSTHCQSSCYHRHRAVSGIELPRECDKVAVAVPNPSYGDNIGSSIREEGDRDGKTGLSQIELGQ